MPEGGIDKGLNAITKLESIGFVEFTTHLVRDVYRTIVEASMDQLKAYAEFVSAIAKTAAEYETEVLGDATAQEGQADSYIKDVLGLTIPSSPTTTTSLSLTEDQATALKQHFLGVTAGITPHLIDSDITAEITLGNLRDFVIAKLKKQTKESYDLIKTILKIGMQKVVVTSGEIHTKLTFHVDAADTYDKTATDYSQKASSWGVRGGISGSKGISGSAKGITVSKLISGGISGGYSGSKISVRVVNEKTTAATNLAVDILGEVRILFRTDTFPSTE